MLLQCCTIRLMRFVASSYLRLGSTSFISTSKCALRSKWSTAMSGISSSTSADDSGGETSVGNPAPPVLSANGESAPTASNVDVSEVSQVVASSADSPNVVSAGKTLELPNPSSVSSVGMYYSPKFLKHCAPRDHPECPERLTAIVDALKADPELSSRIEWLDPPPLGELERADTVREAIEQVHDNEEYLDELKRISKSGGALDADTYVAPGSWEISLLAVSAWLAAVDRTLDTGQPSFALARPPGHHATPTSGMGFCLLSNAAIAAKYALRKHGLSRVVILDWDVHHGNGTEAAVKDEERIRFVSSHEYPLYPMSGLKGKKGNILNVNLDAGSSIEQYWPVYSNEMLPHLFTDKEAPELVIVSAGYDALDDDPLANIELEPKDFGKLTSTLVEKIGHNRIVFGLEGGYSLSEVGISGGVCETIRALLK